MTAPMSYEAAVARMSDPNRPKRVQVRDQRGFLAAIGLICAADEPAPIHEQTDAQRAVDALNQAMDLLKQAGSALPRIAFLTRAAISDADAALMIADNELKLAANGDAR